MKVKKYIANTMPEALEVIRKELGPEAVILHSKEVKRKGFFGFSNKKCIEVIATIDPQPIQSKDKQKKNNSIKTSKTVLRNKEDKEQATILAEINHLKKMMELQSKQAGADLPLDYQLAFKDLIDQEVDPAIAEEIIQAVIKQLENNQDQANQEEIQQTMKLVITEKIKQYAFQGISDEKKIIQFVGPTGVGKTTTIAKIAAKLMLEKGKKVAFITTDTYRIAAIEQLKTYARILNVPLEVAYHADDYKKAIEKLARYDVILVDTAGRNFRDEKYVQELQKIMGDYENIATYLVLALTAKSKDLNDIYDQFYQIPLEALIFTKIDETTQYGSMLNIVLHKQIGIAYATNGQDVPDNILHLSAKAVSKLVVGETNE